jgi:phenylpropionate dioxygenase-like ring-hydroxylating dioxygenase large terminal subunit
MAFADPGAVQEGWLWAAASRDVKRGAVKPVEIAGRKLALYRGQDGVARAVDAFCPHMGAHLALGRVEGDGLRCFFHAWRFDRDGRCAEIPALEGRARPDVCVKSHELHEEDGLIWIWVGDGAASFLPPIHQALRRARRRRALLVARWRKACHHNVVLVNAIDEQHFRTVHNVPGEALRLEPESVAPHHFRVANSGAPPKTSLMWRLVAMLYRGETMTYEIDY